MLKYLQTHYLLFSFFILYLIIPLILILAGFLCAHSLEFVSENIITVISGILAYIGTTVLGMISVWQNKQAFVVNSRLMHLQKSEFEKNKSSIIRFKQDCQIKEKKLSQSIFDQTQQFQNFYFLTDKTYTNNTQDCKQLIFYFESIGHELNQIKIPKLQIKSETQNLSFYQTKHQFKTGFSYDFEKQSYKLLILLFGDFQKKMFEQSTFKIFMNLELLSKANIQSNLNITFDIKSLEKTKKITDIFYFYDDDKITHDN